MTPLLVGEAMLEHPQVGDRSMTVDEARAVLLSAHVHLVLLTTTGLVGEPLLGTVVRDDLPAEAHGDANALSYASLSGRVVRADATVEEVRGTLHKRGTRRLAVVDGSGLLLGLLCLKRDGTGFCSDAGVRARRAHRDGVQ
jgi:CBS domain-containing protein